MTQQYVGVITTVMTMPPRSGGAARNAICNFRYLLYFASPYRTDLPLDWQI